MGVGFGQGRVPLTPPGTAPNPPDLHMMLALNGIRIDVDIYYIPYSHFGPPRETCFTYYYGPAINEKK